MTAPSIDIDHLRNVSTDAIAVAKTYPISFALPEDKLGDDKSFEARVKRAEAEKNPILKAAWYQVAADTPPNDRKLSNDLQREWASAVAGAEAHMHNAQIVAKQKKALLRGEHESVEKLRERQNLDRAMVSTVNANGVEVLALPTVGMGKGDFNKTFKGEALRDAEKQIAGKFDWGALLAMAYVEYKRGKNAADYQWKRQMDGFAATNPLGKDRPVEAVRDSTTGNIQFQVKGGKEGLTLAQQDKLLREFNTFLTHNKDKTGDMSVVSADKARAGIDVTRDPNANQSGPQSGAGAAAGTLSGAKRKQGPAPASSAPTIL